MTKHEAIEILKEVKMIDDSMFAYSQAYNDALDMAIKALKAQEPHVMTFDEIVAAAPGTVVWLEDYDKTDVIAGLVKKVYIYTKVIDFLIVNEKVNDEVTADLDAYSEGWRCWTSRPTDARREAEPWTN